MSSKSKWFAPLAPGSDQYNVSTSFYNPGPGTYNMNKSHLGKWSQILNHKAMVIAPEKNSPSIPFKRFPPSLHTGKANDSVGPNYYEPSKELI